MRVINPARKLLPRKRKLVQQVVLNLTNYKLDYPEFEYFIGMRRKTYHKFLGFIIVLTFSCICGYQVYDRVSYYMTEPIAVDVTISRQDAIELPVIKVCSEEVDYLTKKWGKITTTSYKCFNLLLFSLNDPELNISEIWNTNTNSNRVKEVELVGVSNSSPLSIEVTTEKSVFGICTTVKTTGPLQGKDIDGRIRVSIAPSPICAEPLDLVQFADPIDYEFFVNIVSGHLNYFYGRVKKYSFLNSKREKCTGKKDFVSCFYNCFYAKYQQQFKCSLPFLPLEHQQYPMCQPSQRTQKIYQETLEIATNINQYKTCNCPRRCEQVMYYPDVEFTELPENQTQVEYQGNVGDVVSYQDRFHYDTIRLIVDIAGILGLWLGLSALSIIHITTCVIMSRVNNYQLKSLKNSTSVEIRQTTRTVVDKFNSFNKEHQIQLIKKVESSSNLPTRKCNILTNVVIYLCLVMLATIVVETRIQLYLAEPTRTVVHIDDQDEVLFPDITECVLTGYINFKRNILSKKLKQTTCNVQILDLLDLNENVDVLWKKSLQMSLTEHDKDIKEKLSNFDFSKLNTSFINTPFGKCSRTSFAKAKYYGISSTFATCYFTLGIGKCDSNIIEIYINVPQDITFSLSDLIIVPSSAVSGITFLMAKIVRINTRRKPCTLNPDQCFRCKERCLVTKVQKLLHCSLPFTPEVNKSRCNTSTSAKEAQSEYIKIYLTTNVVEECLCPIPCEEDYYVVRSFSYASMMDSLTVITYVFSSNKVETVSEVLQYTIISLVCDVANILGLALGFSVLNFFKKLSEFVFTYKCHPRYCFVQNQI